MGLSRRRTIARLKGETPPLLVDVDLALDFLDFSPGAVDPGSSACLPYAYVEDEAHRMILHRRIAEAVAVQEVRALRDEVTDRYGKPPPAGIVPDATIATLAELPALLERWR